MNRNDEMRGKNEKRGRMHQPLMKMMNTDIGWVGCLPVWVHPSVWLGTLW